MPHTVWVPTSLLSRMHARTHTHTHARTHTHTHTSLEGPRATTNLLTLEVADGKVIQRKEAPLPALAL